MLSNVESKALTEQFEWLDFYTRVLPSVQFVRLLFTCENIRPERYLTFWPNIIDICSK